MRLRALVALPATLAACTLVPAVASAADTLAPFSAKVTAQQAAILEQDGFDVQEGGFDASRSGAQEVEFAATSRDVARLERAGIQPQPLPIDQPVPKSAALGDSPNPFFNVYRSYMEPGGIADEMRQLAADNPDVFKLERIGTSTLGKPILAIKMTQDARNVPDGTRDAILFSAVNHAREWIAAEMGRRLPGWFADHKNDPKIRELIRTRELWFLPIQNPDGYDFTFTCGLGDENEMCDYRVRTEDDNRFWRKTLRDNNENGVYGDREDGVDPNRNYPAKRGIDEEGASNSFRSGTYRGPYALSEPEDLAVDRLQRRVHFKANINYHSAGQLLLTPVSYTTDYYPPDSTLFDAITGTDGDEAVFPYRSQHSSDLYESNGDTIDNAYMNYGIIGWTPEMDTCETLGGNDCNQFASPDDEAIVRAVFQKNLAFALNVTYSLPNLGRPRNFDDDPSQYQVKATQDIQPKLFDVSYGAPQIVEATIRKELGPAFVTASVEGERDSVTVRMEPAPAGERYNEVRGYYFERRRATIPDTIDDRPLQEGDVVNVVVKAGGLRQEFNYRIAALADDPSSKRVLVVADEDYTGVSPNVTPGYDTAPRYLDEHVSALEAAGYEVEVFDIDAPPENGGTPNGVVRPQIKYPTDVGVLSHFDAVNWYSGDDFAPQPPSETDPRHMTSPTEQEGSREMAGWAHHLMLEMRDYLNEGGKLLVDGRNIHQIYTSTRARLSATGPYTWTPDKLFGFYYPPNNAGDDDLPGTAWLRSRTISNDTWQNYLGVIGRQGGVGEDEDDKFDGAPVAPKSGSLFDGMAPFTVDTTAGNDPNQASDGTPLPQAKSPLRLNNWSSESENEPLRQETVQADYATNPPQDDDGGAVISTRDAVTFGFGLEQVDEATRDELVQRSMAYLLPPTPDTTPPTIVGFKYPTNLSDATTRDPVEIELTVFDERGDMDHVDLMSGDELVQRTAVYPFQFRYTPPASAVGSVVKLTAVAVDKAGNTATRDLYVNVLDTDQHVESPVPVNPPTLLGTPTVGSTLSCISGGFLNAPRQLTYAWLRSGDAIAGATSPTYTLSPAELGRTIACRISATNAAGTGDATSEALYVSNPVPQPAPFTAPVAAVSPAAPAAVAPAATRKVVLKFVARCKLGKRHKTVACTVRSNRRARFSARMRLAGHKKATARKHGKRRVHLRLHSHKRISRHHKVVLTLRHHKTRKVIRARLGGRRTKVLRASLR